MITVEKGNADLGHTYFAADDYYTLESGEWFGVGANELGLTGKIDKEIYDYLIDGFGPDGSPLVRNAEKKTKIKIKDKGRIEKQNGRIAFHDITMSPPKSISLMYHKDAELIQAHRTAVQKTLEEIEKKYATTREGAHSEKHVLSGNLIVAKFEHYESRELDPQIHTHCVVMNMTKRHDGKWCAIENKPILQNQKLLDQIYLANLAHEVKLLGYATRKSNRKGIKGNPVEAFELECISDSAIENYSKRNEQVWSDTFDDKTAYQWKKLQERLVRGEISTEGYKAQKRKLIDHAKLNTRKTKNKTQIAEIMPSIIKAVQEELKDVSIPERPTAHRVMQIKELSDRKSVAVVRETVTHLEKTNSTLEYNEVMKKSLLNARGVGILPEQLDKIIPEYIEILPSGLYTTPRLKAAALESVSLANSGRRMSTFVASRDSIESYLQSQEVAGVEFKDTQRETIMSLCLSRDSVNILQGDAGTGKTFAIKHLRNILEREGCFVRGMAPTGKASTGLLGSVSATSTIDSFFASRSEIAHEKEVWVVDECSMVGNIQMAELLRRAKEHNAKVILMGDYKQLQSVSAGRAMGEILAHTSITRCVMDEVVRQKTVLAKRVVGYSTIMRGNKALDLLNRNGKVHELSESSDRLKCAVERFFQRRENGENVVIMTQTNRARHDANRVIRSALVESGLVEYGTSMQVFAVSQIQARNPLQTDNYEIGQVLVCGKDLTAVNNDSTRTDYLLRSGVEVTVVEKIDDQNSLVVSVKEKGSGNETRVHISLVDTGNHLTAFDVQKKPFGLGDEILFLKNDGVVGVNNGETATITGISDEGKIIAHIADRDIDVSFTSAMYPHFDYGYAMTNHKIQGATVDSAIVLCDNAEHTNAQEWYVGVTRVRNDIEVFTDNLDIMRERVCESNLNHSILEEMGMKTHNLPHKEVNPHVLSDNPIPEVQPELASIPQKTGEVIKIPELVDFDQIREEAQKKVDSLKYKRVQNAVSKRTESPVDTVVENVWGQIATRGIEYYGSKSDNMNRVYFMPDIKDRSVIRAMVAGGPDGKTQVGSTKDMSLADLKSLVVNQFNEVVKGKLVTVPKIVTPEPVKEETQSSYGFEL